MLIRPTWYNLFSQNSAANLEHCVFIDSSRVPVCLKISKRIPNDQKIIIAGLFMIHLLSQLHLNAKLVRPHNQVEPTTTTTPHNFGQNYKKYEEKSWSPAQTYPNQAMTREVGWNQSTKTSGQLNKQNRLTPFQIATKINPLDVT